MLCVTVMPDMASIHRQGDKPNYFCAFFDPEGFRRFRSTGTDNRKIASQVCAAIDRASNLARQGKLSNEKGLRLMRETVTTIEEAHGKLLAERAGEVLKENVEEFIRIAGGELTSYTIKSWFESWLAARTGASKATIVEYKRITELFSKFLGARAEKPLTTLNTKQVEEFKQQLAKRVAPSTVNKAVKVLKSALANAVAKRQLEFSPAEHVQGVAEEEGNRRPFTADELKKLLKAADSDWITMILMGYYTGLRLSDCANLTWQNIDLVTGTIKVGTQKTGRWQVLPIAEPLSRHIEKLAGDNPNAPMCASLHGKPASQLSAAFYDVMVKAGLVLKRDEKKKGTGKGRDAKRDTNRISFHSLRHNTTSALKSAGVGDSVAMDIVGHETASVSRNYTKIDDATKRAAINKLPDITT